MVGMGLISRRCAQQLLRGLCVFVLLTASSVAIASEYHGIVTSGGLPVPGATVTVTQGSKKFVTVTDLQGFFSIPVLADGAGTIQVAMTGFSLVKQEVTVAPNAAMGKWELKQLSLDQIRSTLKPVLSAGITIAQTRNELKKTGAAPTPQEDQPSPPPSDETADRAKDGLLINGSVNNAATSQFTLAQRFGNTASGRSLYNFSLNLKLNNSALDAKSFSLTGVDTSKPQTSQITGGFALEGPLNIPHLLRHGPDIFVGYQRTRDSVAITTPGLVPDQAERNGDFSQKMNAQGQPLDIYNPVTGQPYPGNKIPISPQAQALLKLYPLPNFGGNAQYNYQVPLITDTHQDALISNVSKTIGRNNQVTGRFAATSTRDSSTNLLGFVDATNGLGMSSKINWAHTFNARLRMNLGYQLSRQSTRLTPYWQNRTNISGEAGITGNDQDATYWGPPTLNFSGGLTSLTDGQSSFIRNVTNGMSYIVRWNHWSSHNLTGGFDFKREQFNYLSQANPRGTFTFTGAATAGGTAGSGSDVADFLLGIPDTSALAFGNADKYLRQSVYDAYLNDDWRVTPQLTIDAGVRWEYGAPITELKGRLVNLDVATGFSAIAPVLANDPRGALTGQSYPHSLMRPDRNGIEPRIGLSWRPIPGSSMVIGAGYGVTYDTSVYEGIALQMAQQAPLSKSLTVQNSAACPLTLARGFNLCPETTPQIFGVDPNYRVGYVHTWSLKVQRDLPGSLQMVVTYLGIKGTRGAQEFLPNTNPVGAVNPCPGCPSGFEYLVSNGNSTRQSGQIQLRRRLRSGFTASVLYTFSKSIDDDSALGGEDATTKSSATIAQDWRNLRGERGLSTFDQRHLVKVQVQYTTGMGMSGGTLMSGWRGRLYKEWTVQTQIIAGSGLPQTPLYSVIPIAGYPGIVRPNVTGASIYDAPPGLFLNPAAFTAPLAGQWGNARRDGITGPSQFSLDTSMTRTFRLKSKLNLDLQIAATNALNHVTYSGWIPNINSTQFGLPATANSMRSLQTALRLRF
jgi:hypothetical protein